jgi:hypothetical protein
MSPARPRAPGQIPAMRLVLLALAGAVLIAVPTEAAAGLTRAKAKRLVARKARAVHGDASDKVTADAPAAAPGASRARGSSLATTGSALRAVRRSAAARLSPGAPAAARTCGSSAPPRRRHLRQRLTRP